MMLARFAFIRRDQRPCAGPLDTRSITPIRSRRMNSPAVGRRARTVSYARDHHGARMNMDASAYAPAATHIADAPGPARIVVLQAASWWRSPAQSMATL